MPTTNLRIGNTYSRLGRHEAPLDRSGSYRKVHDWILFVDVENPALIERVKFDLGDTFEPPAFICRSPVPTNDGWFRFSTRQRTYAFITAGVQVRGTGGTVVDLRHTVGTLSTVRVGEFHEYRVPQPLKCVKMQDEAKFGIELELTVPLDLELHQVRDMLEVSGQSVVLVDSYRAGHRDQVYTPNAWKMVPDSSIQCDISQRNNCNTFELVSPILYGGNGLSRVHQILQHLPPTVSTNESTGFHVHVDVSEYSTRQLVKICQQFVKYEEAIDTCMDPWRRTRSEPSMRFFQSNRDALGGGRRGDPVGILSQYATNIHSLADLMNPNGERYFKLNLMNIVSGRQPTLEFRQHAASASYEDVAAWIRFCTRFCENAARLVSPQAFASQTSVDQQFEALFWYVIKDRALRDHYQQRRAQLASSSACCDACVRRVGVCRTMQ